MLILSSFTKLYALDAGVSYEIKRFQQDIGTAAPIIEDALTKMKADFTDNLGGINTTSNNYLWTNESGMSAAQSSIAEIRSGWVYSTATFTANNGLLKELPSTAFGSSGSLMQTFIVQVTFQDTTDISPTLRNRTVTFVAYGLGPDHNDITSSSASAASPMTASDMASVSGFRCHLEANSSSDKPGYIYLQDSDAESINLWNFVEGSFSKCKYLSLIHI